MNLRLLKKLIDNTAIDCRTIGGFFGIDGKIKDNIKRSFFTWEPRCTPMDYISQNMGTHLSIDEVASQGELYTCH
jgi:hypothetical protein